MEYVNLIAEIIARWMLIGTIVMYVFSSLSYISGLIESGCTLRNGILAYLTRAPRRIFEVWMIDVRYVIKSIILWPLTLFDYGGTLYDEYSQLFKKS